MNIDNPAPYRSVSTPKILILPPSRAVRSRQALPTPTGPNYCSYVALPAGIGASLVGACEIEGHSSRTLASLSTNFAGPPSVSAPCLSSAIGFSQEISRSAEEKNTSNERKSFKRLPFLSFNLRPYDKEDRDGQTKSAWETVQ